MYPTISDLINDLFGVYIPLPIQTYGFFVALAFISAYYITVFELKRKEKLGILKMLIKKETIGEPAKIFELLLSGLIGFAVGFKLVEGAFNYTEFVDNPQEFILSGRGSWVGGIIVALISAFWTYYEKRKEQLEKPKLIDKEIHPYELSGTMLLLAAVFGLLGTKVFHNLENIDDLIANPIDALFSFSGLSFYGGLVFGGFALFYYGYKNGIKPLILGDCIAPGVALAYSIGRLGCHVSGDGCWGVPNAAPKPGWMSFLPDWLWAYDFPHNVVREGHAIDQCTGKFCTILDTPVFPSSLYETLIMLVIFGILWTIRKRIKIHGIILFIYFVFAGIERFFIEKIRVNNKYHLGNFEFTQAELISVILFFGGIAAIVYLVIMDKKKKQIHNDLKTDMQV